MMKPTPPGDDVSGGYLSSGPSFSEKRCHECTVSFSANDRVSIINLGRSQADNDGGQNMVKAFQKHWPEYLMEAAELGMFMVSACMFASPLEHPASPVAEALPYPTVQRFLIGIAMGLTVVAIIDSPWGRQSCGHLNPSVTLTFIGLGKVEPWDALFYIAAPFLGGIARGAVATAFLHEAMPIQQCIM